MKFDITRRHLAWKGFFSIEQYEFRHERFAGGWLEGVKREIFERGNAVAVLLHDPKADTLLLVEQFRPGAAVRNPEDAWMIEIVAGIVEEGESNEDVARRESLEEAGCTVNALEHIMDYYPSAGGSSEIISLYYAPVDLSGMEPGIRGLEHEHEDIRVMIVSRQDAMDLLAKGKIQASLAIIALQWLALRMPIPTDQFVSHS